jgi:hypothetical protein
VIQLKTAISMKPQDLKKRRRLRYGLRSLFFTMTAIAALLWSGLCFYDWYFSVPLSAAVEAFNDRAAEDPVGKLEPKLTEDEVISSIQSQLPTLAASSQVKTIYSRIARRRRLPLGASLDSIPGYSPALGQQYTVWWINLDVMTGKKAGFGLRIRETNHPSAATPSVPAERLPAT